MLTVMLTQEPTPAPSPEPEAFLLTPIFYILLVLIISGIVAWKYKAIPDFIVIVCSTISGFIIGFIATPPYGNVGLGMIVAVVGLLLSIAAVTFIRILKPKEQRPLPKHEDQKHPNPPFT